MFFELKPGEIKTPIAFREGGIRYEVSHIFRPPLLADWLAYENHLNRSVEQLGGNIRFLADEAAAAEAVWDRLSLRTEGYVVGSGEMSDCEGWKEKVPLSHKRAGISGLTQVFLAAPKKAAEECYRFNPDQLEVCLAAARGGEIYEELTHVLRRPTAAQDKQFSRQSAEALWVRGSKTSKSLLPSKLRACVEFYDALIVEVRGYVISGQPCTREQAVQFMDSLHKQTVLNGLFTPDLTGPADEEEEAA